MGDDGPVRVIVNGANGRMGSASSRAVAAAPDLTLAGECDLGDDLTGRIAELEADVVVDFTVASAGPGNLETIVRAGAAAVIGTSGFGETEVVRARDVCREHGGRAIVAPNFALASVLLAKYAADAARHFPHVELLEMHHARKEESPSGTALKVAADIAAHRKEVPEVGGHETVEGVRGGRVQGVTVHSVRIPGILARMECLFGGPGETLSLRHDTLTRESFMPGVLLAVRAAPTVDGLVYGLEHLL